MVFVLALLSLPATAKPLEQALSCEEMVWKGSLADVSLNDEEVHGGERSLRLLRTTSNPNEQTVVRYWHPVRAQGEVLRLSAFIKTSELEGEVSLWMWTGDGAEILQQMVLDPPITASAQWTEVSVELPFSDEAAGVMFGVLFSGAGSVWIDDLTFTIDGLPVADAPIPDHLRTVLDSDHQFDDGSKIAATSLTEEQVARLVLLAKVWSYAKVYHPEITGGRVHWDYSLFRLIPLVLSAASRGEVEALLVSALSDLGPLPPCAPCAEKPTQVALPLSNDWTQALSSELSSALSEIYAARSTENSTFFVHMAPGAGNVVFTNESRQPAGLPDAGYRLLALFRVYGAVRYWYPYRDLLDSDLDEMLASSIAPLFAANTKEVYELELLKLVSHLDDSHGLVAPAYGLVPPVGRCKLPIQLRYVEEKVVVWRTFKGASPLQVGDVLLSLNGVPLTELATGMRPYLSASNSSSLSQSVARKLTAGDCGPVVIEGLRGSEPVELTVDRQSGLRVPFDHERPGEPMQALTDEVLYVKLSSSGLNLRALIKEAEHKQALIIDLRGYPKGMFTQSIGRHLVKRRTAYALFTSTDTVNPGVFVWGEPTTLKPKRPTLKAKVFVLVDEASVSSAEFHAMAFAAGAQTVVVGSTTAGADGNISILPLPGEQKMVFTGLGVFTPNKQPTQQVGVVPDVVAVVSVDGILSGRDEVLEEALRLVGGLTEDEVREVARRKLKSP